jgi:hypothetical protein
LTVLGGTDVAVDVNANAMSVNGRSRVDLHAVESLDMAEL